jgi:alpha-acetolactate decarboxylase
MARSAPDLAVLPLIAILCGACGKATPPPAKQSKAPATVRFWGELRSIMHEGDRAAKVALRDVVRLPHIYAVGALSELRGEVTILDGEIWLAYPAEGDAYRIQRRTQSDERATLLVAAQVGSWREQVIGEQLAGARLDEAIARLAHGSGIDTSRPFPLLLEGRFPAISFHVIDGRRMGANLDHHAHGHGGMIVRSERNRRAQLVGFFSDQHAGVFTHMGQRTHLHVVAESPEASGHVDELIVAAGTVLKLPR